MENSIQSLLISLGICSPDSIQEFYPHVRDRNDIKVMHCIKSGVIFLQRSDHIDALRYYEKKDKLEYWSAKSRQEALLSCLDDDRRRAEQFESTIRNKRWLDIGTGVGGILDLLAPHAAYVCAVEPQVTAQEALKSLGYRVYRDVGEVEETNFDVITLFHVFEHMPNPLEALHLIASKMEKGQVIVEVPHAKDALLTLYDLDVFKEFTLWSEHLVLHTRVSLEAMLRKAGFRDIQVIGYQRYPLANHLYWLSKGQPGGHKEWSFMSNNELDNAYGQTLDRLDYTDTLIAIAFK
jgi:2-polyprenyl-3-methyl-5-hydroxy-6-metoxy-1,4-benzoquinol methylase